LEAVEKGERLEAQLQKSSMEWGIKRREVERLGVRVRG